MKSKGVAHAPRKLEEEPGHDDGLRGRLLVPTPFLLLVAVA